MVGRLRNAIQVVFNCYDDLMKEMNRELYTLQKYRARLMEDKSDPLISQAKIQKKIEENQAEIKPLIAEAEILKNICEEFAQDVELLCDKTAVRFKTSGKGPKEDIPDFTKGEFLKLIAKVERLERDNNRLTRELTQSGETAVSLREQINSMMEV